jgi:hypothetical protein
MRLALFSLLLEFVQTQRRYASGDDIGDLALAFFVEYYMLSLFNIQIRLYLSVSTTCTLHCRSFSLSLSLTHTLLQCKVM